MSDLKKWLNENKFFKPVKNEKPSHLLYDGGKIYVPREKDDEFLKYYAMEMEKGSRLYYVETRPKIFKFMIDLDITDEHYWSLKEITDISKLIQNVIYDFFEKKMVVICATSPEKQKSGGIHTGVHLIWPKLFVSSETAMILRNGIVQKLKEEKVSPKGKSWEDIVDEVIYTKNGYRMVGSDKMVKGIAENRPLKVKFVMKTNGEIDDIYTERILNNYETIALDTSIRYINIKQYTKKNSKGMVIKKLPEWLEDDVIEAALNTDGKRTKKNDYTIVQGNKMYLAVEMFIRTKLPKAYRNVKIKSIRKYEQDKDYDYSEALLIVPDTKYCMNIDKQHNSCGVYFYANTNGLTQRCHCDCNNLNGRKKGYCRDYVSEVFKINEDLKEMFFPEYAKNKFLDNKKKKKFNPVLETFNGKKKQQKHYCDKLLDEILSA